MISALRVSSTLPEPLAIAMPDSASRSAGSFFATVSAAFFANATKSSFFATKSVSQFTSTTAPVLPSFEIYALTTPSAVTRLAALLALAPLLMRSCSSAAFRSPFDSTSAFLHSIMPRPVISRSSLTILAVISDIFYSVIKHLNKKQICPRKTRKSRKNHTIQFFQTLTTSFKHRLVQLNNALFQILRSWLSCFSWIMLFNPSPLPCLRSTPAWHISPAHRACSAARAAAMRRGGVPVPHRPH